MIPLRMLPSCDVELRTSDGANTGVLMMTLHGAPMGAKPTYRALDFLDAGLPITQRPR